MSKISIQWDIAFNIFFPLTATHHFAPVPPVPPVPPPLPAAPLTLAACAFEIPATMFWPPGNLFGKNKLTSTVKHNNCTITLDGHDCGVMIPHVQMAPAPNNMMTAIHIPFSSRKSMFCASTVVMNGKSVACNTLIGLPPTPMMYCADPISMPLASGDTSHLNSVSVGMNFFWDWVIGAATIAASMLIDRYLDSKSPFNAPENWRALAREALQKTILGPGSGWGSFLLKNGLAVATGLARMGLTDGPVSFNITLGDSYFENQAGVSRDSSGNYNVSYTNRVGPASGEVSTQGLTHSVDGLTGSSGESHRWGDPL